MSSSVGVDQKSNKKTPKGLAYDKYDHKLLKNK